LLLLAAVSAAAQDASWDGSPQDVAASDVATYIGDWSDAVDGLQIRMVLRQEGQNVGVRLLTPYIEMRDLGETAGTRTINVDRSSLSLAVVSGDGRPYVPKSRPVRSGAYVPLDVVTLPTKSFLSIFLGSSNWLVEKSAVAQISTEAMCWPMDEKTRGTLYLVATLSGSGTTVMNEKRNWNGTLQSPPLLVRWR